MRQINRRARIHHASIIQYSTTLLLLGSMTTYAANRNHVDHPVPLLTFKTALEQSMVAEYALAHDDIHRALRHYTDLALQSNSTAIKQRALDISLEYNDLRAALQIARNWVQQEPKDVPALFYLAHIALRAHEYHLAASTLNQILNIDPTADLEQILVGIAPESEQDRLILLHALRSSNENYNPSILVLIAGLEAQNGQLEQALDTINLALKKRPRVTGYILLKANLLIALDDQKAAQKWFARSSKMHKNNFDVRLAEVRYLIKINQSELALDKLEQIIEKWPKAEEPKFIAGLTSIDLKQYEKAERYLVELRDSAQYQNESYYYLAVNAERKQHFETAKAYYRLVDGSLYIVSRRNIIAIYEKQNQLNDALRFLTQERVNYPQHASFLYQAQAEILKKMGNKTAALNLLTEAIKNIPDDPELIYAEVLLFDPFTDRDKLDKALKQLLQIEPNSPTYLNAYAYTLALQNRRLNEARKYAELALEYAPEQSSILDTLGYIAFLQNDYDAAAQVLGKAYTLSQNLNIGIRYAKALYMKGAFDEFGQVLQQLKQKHPNDPQLKQLDLLILPPSSS